jgi:DMSO/TMAO reductase YedYZ molybdopterin-dependent catalytic subunit
MPRNPPRDSIDRRELIKTAAAGTVIMGLGGALYRLATDDMTRKAMADGRADGKKRLPPGQRLIEKLKPMGGEEGPGDVKSFKLRVHGLVKTELELDYKALLKLPQVEKVADVHCVTGWTVIDSIWKGVQISTLAEQAGMKDDARYVILEGANGFTANVPLKEATADYALVTYRLDGKPFSVEHGAPVRGLIPDLYFWKSTKWLTGLKFVKDDEPGYWEQRGYNNHADPWKEERYA